MEAPVNTLLLPASATPSGSSTAVESSSPCDASPTHQAHNHNTAMTIGGDGSSELQLQRELSPQSHQSHDNFLHHERELDSKRKPSDTTSATLDESQVFQSSREVQEQRDENHRIYNNSHAKSSSTDVAHCNVPCSSRPKTGSSQLDIDPLATAELQAENLVVNDRDLLTDTTDPPALHTPHKRRVTLMIIGIAVATLDLSFLPITYFYALRFNTTLKLQLIFAIIVAVYGMISFFHFGLRSMKLFFNRYNDRFKPLGWNRWGMLEFFHINTLITIALVEVELVIATAPSDPFLKLCAMPSPTICYYLGGLFIASAILTELKWKLPFNMSSTPKGAPWRPAIYAFIEDCGAIEMRGEKVYREKLNARYEASPMFRRMIIQLSWSWGVGLICIAIVSTVLIFMIEDDVAFGLGWGLPYAFMIVWAVLTYWFVKRSLTREKAVWRAAAAELSTKEGRQVSGAMSGGSVKVSCKLFCQFAHL